MVIDQLGSEGQIQARVWLDDSTGTVLRKQWFSEAGELMREMVLSDYTYDIDFPQDLFDLQLPWRGGYAADYSGKPIPAYGGDPILPRGREWKYTVDSCSVSLSTSPSVRI